MLRSRRVPRKKLACDYCGDEVTPNTVGIDINHMRVKFTICAKCLKSSFDWIAGRQRRGKGVKDASKEG